MRDDEALRLALYLFHLPTAVRRARGQPLPGGIVGLLEVAAGDIGASEAAAARLERPVEVVRQAAAFFIEQILLMQGADAYRVLGGTRACTDSELRRHMALLQRWAHPDLADKNEDREGGRSALAARITLAWDALKTPERRAAYDAANPEVSSRWSRRSGRRPHKDRASGPRPGIWRAALRLLLGARRPR